MTLEAWSSDPAFESAFEGALERELRYTLFHMPRHTPYEAVCASVAPDGGEVRSAPLWWLQPGVADDR